MRYLVKVRPFPILLITFLSLLTCSSGCTTGNPSAPIPDNWTQVEAPNRFTLKLPPVYTEEHAQGIDSYVRSFRRKGVRIGIDYGRYSDPLNHDDELDYQRTETTIDGRKAWWVTFTYRDTPGSMRESGYTRYAAVHVPRPHLFSPNKFTLHAYCAGEEEIEEVLEIFQTIEFK